MREHDFHYALENTKVILPPQKRLETFGTTVLNYHLITEEMDAVNRMLVREGRIHAQKPELVTPDGFAKLLLDGFGEKAEKYADAVSEFASQIAILKYGFSFRKDETKRYEVTGALGEVSDKVRAEVEAKGDPLSAVLTGVEPFYFRFNRSLLNATDGGIKIVQHHLKHFGHIMGLAVFFLQ